MTADRVLIDGVTAHASEQGRVSVSSGDTTQLEVLVPAGVGVPGADDLEFAAALVAVLLRRRTRMPAVLDASAAIAADPQLLSEVVERLEAHWEGDA